MSKSLIGTLEFTGLLIEKNRNLEGTAVDMTLGKGNDTLLLAKHFKKVYAFDIQEIAIEISKTKISEFNNIDFILDSHENIDLYINENVDFFIYNLGYLPSYNEEITTKAKSTLNSLKKALNLLKKKGIIVMVIYSGHPEGLIEARIIEKYLQELNEADYLISKYQFTNRNKSPYMISIQKLGG